MLIKKRKQFEKPQKSKIDKKKKTCLANQLLHTKFHQARSVTVTPQEREEQKC